MNRVTITAAELIAVAEGIRDKQSAAPVRVPAGADTQTGLDVEASDLASIADHVSVNEPAGAITITVTNGEPEATWPMIRGGTARVARPYKEVLADFNERFGIGEQ